MGAAAFRRNAQQQGRPAARAPRPQNIPWSEHTREIQDLTRKYELELLELKDGDTVIASLDAAVADSKRLTDELAESTNLLAEAVATAEDGAKSLEEASGLLTISTDESSRLAGERNAFAKEVATLQALLNQAEADKGAELKKKAKATK